MTGMRKSEILALPWRNVNLRRNTILIDKAWKTNTTLGLPKWNKIREIPISNSISIMLSEIKEDGIYINDDDLVFCTEEGKRLGTTFWNKNFNESCARADFIEKVVSSEKVVVSKEGWKRNVKTYVYRTEDGSHLKPHSFRHSLNTNLLSAGCNPLFVQLYLGWSPSSQAPILTKVQQGYSHLDTDPLRHVVDCIDSIYPPFM